LALLRFLLALLIAVGVTLAPIGSALAALALTQSHPVSMADMPDCPSKTKDTLNAGCCDTKLPCSGDLCLAKCFKLNSEIVQILFSLEWRKPAFAASAPTRPPDNWPEPQAPPPRA
jgi:hypothetical protein